MQKTIDVMKNTPTAIQLRHHGYRRYADITLREQGTWAGQWEIQVMQETPTGPDYLTHGTSEKTKIAAIVKATLLLCIEDRR